MAPMGNVAENTNTYKSAKNVHLSRTGILNLNREIIF
jgi:hypothetical protein